MTDIFDDDQRRDRPQAHLPCGWRRDGPMVLSLLLHSEKASCRRFAPLTPARSPQVLQYSWNRVLRDMH